MAAPQSWGHRKPSCSRGTGGPWLSSGLHCTLPTLALCLQPSLDPLPPYILAEAQLRSQRHRLTLYCGAPGGAFPAEAPGGCFPLSVSPRALPQTQEALVQEAETYMPVRAEPAASALDESRPPGPPSCGAGCCGWAEGT